MLFARAELGRSKLRFGLLTLGAGLLVFVLLCQQLLLGTVLDGMTGAIAHQSAPVLVLARQAQRSVTGSLVRPDQLDSVAATPGVADASELAVTMLSFQGEDEPEESWHEVAVFGYRSGRVGAPTGLRSGRLPESTTEVVVSGEDATGRFGIGDTVTVEPGAVQLTVVGLTEGSRYNVSPTMWVRWEAYEVLALRATPEIGVAYPSAVAVQPSSGTDVATLVGNLNNAFPDLEALTREDAVDTAPGRDSVRLAFMVVIGLGYLVVAVVIGFFFLTLTLLDGLNDNTTGALRTAPADLIAYAENAKSSLLRSRIDPRAREQVEAAAGVAEVSSFDVVYAVLKALGMSSRQLFTGVVTQVLLVTFTAAIVALAATWGLTHVPLELPTTMRPVRFVETLGALGVTSVVGSVLSLRRVVRVDPAAAIG